MLIVYYRLTIGGARGRPKAPTVNKGWSRCSGSQHCASRMTVGFSAFDTGDWSMLLGGFAVAGLLALLV